MIDLTAIIALDRAPRLVAEQFSEDRQAQHRRPRKGPRVKPVRARVARALRTTADALEPAPQRHPAS